MGWIIIIVGFIIFMVVTGRREDKKQVEVKEVLRDNSLDVIKESYKGVGLDYIDILTNVDYYGGFKDVGSTEYCYITLFTDQLKV